MIDRFIYSIVLLTICGCNKFATLGDLKTESDISDILQFRINNALQGDTIYIPSGSFFISKRILLYNQNNLHIIGKNTTIKMKSGTPVNKEGGMLQYTNCNGMSLIDITFDANRQTRKCSEEPAHTISIMGGSNILFKNVNAVNNAVDGFFISTFQPEDSTKITKKVRMENCTSRNSFRNGMSIINGYDIKISGGEFNNSNGIPPGAGIDIEADYDGEDHPGSKNIVLENIECNHNVGWGIMISQKGTPEELLIKNSTFKNNTGGIKVTSIKTTVEQNQVIDNKDIGIQSVQYDGRAKDFNIIRDNTIKGGKTGIYYLGYEGVIENNTISNGSTYGINLIGNTINDTKVKVTTNRISGKLKYGIHCSNFDQATLEKNIIDTNGEVGIIMSNGKQLVRHNRIKGNICGIKAIGSETVIESNLFEEMETGTIVTGGGKYTPTGTLIDNKYKKIKTKRKIQNNTISVQE